MNHLIRSDLTALFMSLALLIGCGAPGGGADRELAPGDFRGATNTRTEKARTTTPGASKPAGASTAALPPEPVRKEDPSSEASGEEPTQDPDSEDPSVGTDGGTDGSAADTSHREDAGSGASERGGYVINAMVGQVNGEPIYAGEIFKAVGDQQLRRLGESLSRQAFRQRAMELIVNELRSRITDALILREAERDLSEREKKGLRYMVSEERKNILSRYKGVQALAERGLQREKGRTLEEELEAFRQRVLVEKFRGEHLMPKVNVTRGDVERYYESHPERFNPPPTAHVRLMIVREDSKARAASEALASDEPFAEVARQYSDVRAEEGGLMPPFKLDGPFDSFHALRWPELNKAARELEEGEHSPRVSIDIGSGWVMLDRLERGEGRPLQEVSLQIEKQLKSQQFNRLSRAQIADLMERGSFTPIRRMADSLLEVAMNRYAQEGT